jgi:hypothetical protein
MTVIFFAISEKRLQDLVKITPSKAQTLELILSNISNLYQKDQKGNIWKSKTIISPIKK